MERRRWSRQELMVVLNLYCRTPFGKLHGRNPDVRELARAIERSTSAVAMKLVNFASLDPTHRRRNVKGLEHSSRLDRKVWDEFHDNWEALAFESQSAIVNLTADASKEVLADGIAEMALAGPSEVMVVRRIRLVQGFFRDAVLASHGSMCAICGLALPVLLNASHIIPWRIDTKRRADPTNGLALCALHDRAFDRGLIAIDGSFSIVISSIVKTRKQSPFHRIALVEIEGSKLRLPVRFSPDPAALAYHRDKVFVQ